MPSHKPRDPSPVTDINGRECLLVPISNLPGSHALVYKEDYFGVLDNGFTATWAYYNNAVHAYRPNTNKAGRVARIIAKAPDTSYVRIKNGNVFDLRRENLKVVSINRSRETVTPKRRPPDFLSAGIVSPSI